MAVFFVSGYESAGKNRRDQFIFAGFVATERDWSEIVAPAWDGLVLNGNPRIPYLHMTDIRSKKWREENGISSEEAGRRVDRAVDAIAAAEFMYPIGLTVSGAHMCDSFANVRVKLPKSKRSSAAFERIFFAFSDMQCSP